MTAGSFIAVEWGSAAIRARLISSSGEPLDELNEQVRLADLDRDGKVARLTTWRERWSNAEERIWLGGMIGSPMGLETVPQFACPATPAAIAGAAKLTTIDGIPVGILPGLSSLSRFGDRDVLRGEEIAAAGLVCGGAGEGAVLLSVPGMHGKWIELSETRVERFHTSMTVELYRVLSEHSILAPLMKADPHDGEAFRRGLTRSADGGGIARLLFSARTAVLADMMSEHDAASYLWGILIGADVRENLPGAGSSGQRYFVTGASLIAPLFRDALRHFGVAAELLDDRILTAAGFAQLRKANTVDGGHA